MLARNVSRLMVPARPAGRLSGMDVKGYTIDRVTPAELPEDEQLALARLFQRMSKEVVPEDPERPLEAIVARIRATSPNEWHARVRARDAKGKDRKSTRLNSSHQIISYAAF